MRCALALAALLLVPLAAAAPEQVHLGLPSGDASTTRSVLWVDLQAEDAPQVTLDTPAGPKTFPAHEVAGPGLGHQYEANLTGLEPGTAYPYHVGERAFTLTTAPGGRNASFTFVALGDMGTQAPAVETKKAIEALQPDFVLHSGDISYAEGRQNEWIAWFGLVEPVAANRPWVTAMGNHETYTATSLVELVPAFTDQRVVSPVELAFYHQRFALPGNELWYSFDWGGAHFVALDTFSQAQIPKEEIDWLDADLAAHANATWRIVFLHEPPYSSGANHGSSERVQKAFGPVFEARHVDLVLAGHEHNYERAKPVRGVSYLVSGGGGEGIYPFGPEKEFTAARHDGYHVLAVRVTPQRLETRYVATDGASFTDALVLERDVAPAGVPTPIVAQTPMTGLLPLLVGLALTALVARRSQ